MRKIILLLVLLFSYNVCLLPQAVIGKLIDDNGNPLFGVKLKLYTPYGVYGATSLADGSVSFHGVLDVDDNVLPLDYSVSEFFPNPFNPRTRIAITLPHSEEIKIEVYNTIGQKVKDIPSQIYNSGTNYLDLELNGLSNGVYISRITIGGKYTIIKKMMLMYGSQHLVTNNLTINSETTKQINKELLTSLDSLIATSGLIWTKKFVNLPVYTGATLDLGNLVVERYCEGVPAVTYSGKTYNTVQIGDQCWLRENLDVGTMIQGSQNATNNSIIEKYCYNNDVDNCNTYGGLYQWNEAMQYATTSGTQGICPEGWHIPTYAELQALGSTVGNNGNSLKAVGQGSGGGAGTNISGFTALLAGYRSTYLSFKDLENSAYFWCSTEYSTGPAYTFYLFINDSGFYFNKYGKELGFSVRCLKDFNIKTSAVSNIGTTMATGGGEVILAGSFPVTERGVCWSTSENPTIADNKTIDGSGLGSFTSSITGLSDNTTYYVRAYATNSVGTSYGNQVSFTTINAAFTCGTRTVTYEGKTYNTVQIGNQCWLKENLDVGIMIQGSQDAANNSIIEKYCYHNSTATCNTYGGLYQWNEAMQYVTTPGTKGICPEGWHIPTYAELQALGSTVGNNGNSLKAVAQGSGGGAGTNTSGFSALLAGIRNTSSGYFYFSNGSALFWSSTESNATFAYRLKMDYYSSDINFYYDFKEYGFSVRCLKD